MSDCRKTADEVKGLLQSSRSSDPQQTVMFYDRWAEMYEQDLETMNFRAPHLAVSFLSEHCSTCPEDVLVLDVACGSGLVAKLMSERGFRHFVGVDGSKGMLDRAAATGLYQDLKLVLLGTQALPAQTGHFDVVILVGALDPGFAPVSVVRELCHAAKPGGLVCMARGDHSGPHAAAYKQDLQRELQLMEAEGLWSLVGTSQVERYMMEPYVNTGTDGTHLFISGTVYLYRRSINPPITTNH